MGEQLTDCKVICVRVPWWRTEPCCIAMAERMRRDMSCNAGPSSGLPDRIPQHLAVNRCTSAAVGTKPAIIAMGQPKTAQFVEDRLGERNSTLFVTLTDDTDKQIDLIDSRDLKRGGLADAQTARIHEKEPALVDGILDAPEDRANGGRHSAEKCGVIRCRTNRPSVSALEGFHP